MGFSRWSLMLLPLLLSACTFINERYVAFGSVDSPPPEAKVTIDEVIADPASHTDRVLKITGEVVSVCVKKGCWLRMAPAGGSESESVFVKFTCPIDGRLIPLEAVGKPVEVDGVVVVETVSEAEARHYAEDAGKSPEEIAAIVGEQQRVRIAASAAKIRMERKVRRLGPTSRPAGR